MKIPKRATRPIHFLCLILTTAVFSACLTTNASSPAPSPIAIDLSPRCEPTLLGVETGMPIMAPREPALSVETLPHGARLLFVSESTTPLDRLAWGFPAPRTHARLAAALLESGEASIDPLRLRDSLFAIGGSISAEVSDDWLWLELRFPPSQRIAALRVFEHWLEVHPPSPDAFQRIQRRVAIAAMAEQSSATKQAERLFGRLHPSAGPAPNPDSPQEDASPADIVDDLRQTLQPESSFALYVSPGGQEATRTVRKRIEAWLASWPTAKAPPPRMEAQPQATSAQQPLPNESGTIHIIDRKGSSQVELLVGFPSVGPDHADAPSLEMLASLLGSDVGGRLFRDLRERQGLAYIINAEQTPHGHFLVSTRARPERVGALLSGIESHYRALAEIPLLPCETRMLARRMTGEAALRVDDRAKLTRSWRSDIARSGAPKKIAARIAPYLAATDHGLEEIARRYLSGQPTLVLVGDAKPLRRDLGRTFPGRAIRVYDGSLRPTR